MKRRKSVELVFSLHHKFTTKVWHWFLQHLFTKELTSILCTAPPRHDNLNSFIGACVEPSSLTVVTDYSTRGSLRNVLDNADVRLDQMFVASLVG